MNWLDHVMPERASRSMRIVACAALSGLLLGANLAPPVPAPKDAPKASASDWVTKEELWYEFTIDNKPCGYTSERVETREGYVRTLVEMELRMGRMGQTVSMHVLSSCLETSNGQMLELTTERRAAAAPVRVSIKMGTDVMEVTEEQGDRKTTKKTAMPIGTWFSMRGAREFVRRRVTSGADKFDFNVLEGEAGSTLTHYESRRIGSGTLTLNGRTMTTSKWESLSSSLDKPSIEEISADGILVRSTLDIGLGTLVTTLSTKEKCLASKGSAEIMARTFVELKQNGARLPHARRSQLRVTGNAPLGELPSAGSQRTTQPSPTAAVLDIDIDAPQRADPGDETAAKYRNASVLADSEEPRIKALAAKAVKGAGPDVRARVDALRVAVGKHLTKKNLASGFATATEAVASRSGDCSEHALLLVACLRASGIPARAAAGLMYVESFADRRNVFGWHMWAQALVDGAWIDVDAVLPAPGPRTDPGHVLVVTSAVDGATLDMDVAQTIGFLGGIEIEIVSIDGVAAKPRVTPAKSPPAKTREVPAESDQ